MLFSAVKKMTKLQENTFLREIPNNLLTDPKVEHLAKSLQKSLDDMLDWANKINYRMNIEILPDEIIEHLLWESHITWKEGLALVTTRQQKINLIQSAVDIHRRKGTPYAIERVLEALELPGEVIEWFQYGGKPYYFKLRFDLNGHFDIHQLKMLIEEYKNTRSWLENITFTILDRPINKIDHDIYLKKKLEPETTWFGGRYNQDLGTLIDGTWRINGTYLLNPAFVIEEDTINQVRYHQTQRIEKVFNEYEENLALLINGDWSVDGIHTLDNPPRLVKLRPIKHEVSIFERKIYERVIDGTWYLDGSLTVGVQRLMNGTWDMDGEYLMDGDRTKDL